MTHTTEGDSMERAMKTWEEMSARERDALVAEKVMGDPVDTSDPWFPVIANATGDRVPDYTTSISAAWMVAERRFIRAGLSAWIEGDGHTGYEAGVTTAQWLDLARKEGRTTEGVQVRFTARGECPAEALSLAALRAKGVEV